MGIAGVGTVLGAPVLDKSISFHEKVSDSENASIGNKILDEAFQTAESITETSVITILNQFYLRFLNEVLPDDTIIGMPLDNSPHPFFYLNDGKNGKQEAYEELLFRLGPSLLTNLFGATKGGVFWEVGVPIQYLFAVIHGTSDKEGKRYIPAPQFILGLFYWYLQRKKGVHHNVLSHIFSNQLIYMMERLSEDPPDYMDKYL